MKEMVVERSIEVKGILVAEQVRLQCQLNYHDEDDGKRAIGNIYVRGIYFDGERKRPLREIVVLDVLAPSDKLDVDEEFFIELVDSSYDIQNQCLKLMITLHVHGVLEDEVEELMEVFAETDETNILHNYRDDVIEIIEERENLIVNDEEVDAFCQTENKLSYRMILLKENSSYEVLASKYGVDINALRNLNKQKKLDCDTLVVLPNK